MRARANALLDTKRPAEAIALLLGLAGADPADSQTFCLLSLAYLQAGQPDEALAAAGTAAAASPTAEWPHRLRSSALVKLGRKKEALAAARQAVALAPQLPECHILLAEAEVANGHLKEARIAAEQARELVPERPGGHVMLSMVAAQAGRWTDVEHHARLALSIDPEDTAALNNLGVALQKLGHRREAVHYLGVASRLDPRNPLYKNNAVRAASRYWGPGLIVGLIAITFAGRNIAWGFGLGAIFVAGRVIGYTSRGRSQVLWRTPLEWWSHRSGGGSAQRSDPKASPELMSALRKERKALRTGAPRPLRLVACGIVATGAVVFGIAFAVAAATSTRGAGDVAVNAVSAVACAAVTAVMFRLVARSWGTRQWWRRR